MEDVKNYGGGVYSKSELDSLYTDSAVLMTNEDFKVRFQAEYNQVKIRELRLRAMVASYEAGTLKFTPTCPIHMFRRQLEAMSEYAFWLEERAELEHVELIQFEESDDEPEESDDSDDLDDSEDPDESDHPRSHECCCRDGVCSIGGHQDTDE